MAKVAPGTAPDGDDIAETSSTGVGVLPDDGVVGAIAAAAAADDRLEELRAMRLRLAVALDSEFTPARDLASLSRRQIEIGREIAALKREAEEAAHEANSAAVPDEPWDPAKL